MVTNNTINGLITDPGCDTKSSYREDLVIESESAALLHSVRLELENENEDEHLEENIMYIYVHMNSSIQLVSP